MRQRFAASHAAFAGLLACSLLASAGSLRTLLGFCLEYEHYSHILLVPFVALGLVWMERKQIFERFQWSLARGIPLLAAGIAVFVVGRVDVREWSANDQLALALLGSVIFWLGAFLLCYGPHATRRALFPLLFLLFLVPIPDAVLKAIIAGLLRGSTEVADVLFQLSRTTVLREGPVFYLSNLTIRVADECSGIRSSLALFILTLLAGHFFLRSLWRRTALVVAALPVLVFKNGVRIVTITLLSVHVDPAFLTGRLHRGGGVFFFTLGLLMVWPVLRILEKSERESPGQASGRVAPADSL